MTAINYGQTYEFEGLGTFNMVVPNAGDYIVDAKIMAPVPVGGGVSSVLPVVKLNNTTKFTGIAGAQGAWVQIVGASAGDTIKLVLSSSNAADQGLNVIKSTVAISQYQ